MEEQRALDASVIPSFEDFKHQNGISYWYAREFMEMLGYDQDEFDEFKKKVLGRATQTFISLGVDHYSEINRVERIDGGTGNTIEDFKLSRFACYIVAMNASTSKKEVALAQAYFAEATRKFELSLQGSDDIARLVIRDELAAGQKSLMDTAAKSGVQNYADFNNAGYIGLYNKTAEQLKRDRKLPEKASTRLQDYMGRTELAANLFRVTQTEERLKQDNISNESQAKKIHYNVGTRIRQMVEENTGKFPEQLPVEKKLMDVKKDLKVTKKELEKIDGPAKKKK